MTVIYISCSQYRADEHGNTKEVSTYFLHLMYLRPTSLEEASRDFIKTYSESHFAREGWKLVGEPAFLVLKPKLYVSLIDYIDEGIVDVEETTPARTPPRLSVVQN